MTRASLILALLACAAFAGTARAATNLHTCWSGYSYAGAQSPARGFGISGQLTMSAAPSVQVGHVAAWLGVGGAGLGPGGSDEWLQAGIAKDAGGVEKVYYEYKRPGDAHATFVPLFPAARGVSYSIVVYERPAQRDAWRVMVDGVKVSDPVVLPGSHGLFQPVATAENWDGGSAGSCNGYSFDFAGLAVRTQWGGAWQAFELSRVLRDPAYQLSLRASGFAVSSR